MDRVRIKEVAAHIRAAGKASFVIGAGASISAGIPSANGLIRLIETDFPHVYKNLTDTERKSYGSAMSKLFPVDRKNLIVPLLERAKTSWGHIALAALLRGGHVERVLTFNFDLLLERAASMLGVHLPVYDFGTSATADVNRLVSPSIIHLHGQSHGMVLLNSDEETKAHAEILRPVLRDTLRNHLTIVIGYSGEADAAFRIFCEDYNSYTRLIWLGHDTNPPAHIRGLLADSKAEYIGGCDFDRVMIDLAKDLGDWPPLILKNPMDHVTEVLEPTTEFPVGEQGDEDFLSEIRSRLADFSSRWKSEATPDSRAYDAGLGIADDSRKAGANGDMGKDEQPLSEGAKLALAWSLVDQGVVLYEEARTLTGGAARAKFVEAGAKYAEAVQIKPDMDAAFYNWGIALYEEARTLTGDAARAKFVEAGAKYAEAVRIKPYKHWAFNNWGNALYDQARALTGDAARAKFAEAGAKYAEAVQIKPDLHEAFENWGMSLLHLAHLQDGDDREASLTLAMEVLTKAATISGKAIYNLACLLAIRGDVEKAVAQLHACKFEGTLPDGAHLDADADLEGIGQDPAYLAFRASLT